MLAWPELTGKGGLKESCERTSLPNRYGSGGRSKRSLDLRTLRSYSAFAAPTGPRMAARLPFHYAIYSFAQRHREGRSLCLSCQVKNGLFLLTKRKHGLKVSKVLFEEWFPDGRRPWRSAYVRWERNRSCSRHQRNAFLSLPLSPLEPERFLRGELFPPSLLQQVNRKYVSNCAVHTGGTMNN